MMLSPRKDTVVVANIHVVAGEVLADQLYQIPYSPAQSTVRHKLYKELYKVPGTAVKTSAAKIFPRPPDSTRRSKE
jgi:hypothetical protein